MTPTFLFIMWMCKGSLNCPMWEDPHHTVIVQGAENRRACEADIAEAKAIPDPHGYHAIYRCQPIGEDL